MKSQLLALLFLIGCHKEPPEPIRVGNIPPTVYYDGSGTKIGPAFLVQMPTGFTGSISAGKLTLSAGSLPATNFTGAVTFSGGVLASGSNANDFSGGSGAFKTSTGAVTLGSGAITISGSVAESGSNNFDLSAGTGLFKTTTGAFTLGGANAGGTVSLGTGALTITSTAATARAGTRNASTRNIIGNSSVAVPDCTGATLNLTVTQVLDAHAATCGTAQTINFPTWQGASGIVQGMPGTPAVGDEIRFKISATAANALTIGAGTGGTISGGTTVAGNTSHDYLCKVTSITSNSETVTCY